MSDPGLPAHPPLRRLSMVPDPVPGEAFHSWCSRIAEAHGIRLEALAGHLGIPTFTPRRYVVGTDLFDLHGEQMYFDNVHLATGLGAGRMAAMTLMRYGHDRLFRRWSEMPGSTSAKWIWRIATPAVCPQCLAEPEGAWKIAWHLLPVVACPTHQAYLHGWCPYCRSRISIDGQRAYLRSCAGPYGPSGPTRFTTLCRIRLSGLPRRPLRNERVLEPQDALIQRLRDPAPRTEDDPQGWWERYELLFRLVIYLATPDMLPLRTEPHLWWAFYQFCDPRDTLALTDGDEAREAYQQITYYQPGPLLTAAAMLIIDEIAPGGDMFQAPATSSNSNGPMWRQPPSGTPSHASPSAPSPPGESTTASNSTPTQAAAPSASTRHRACAHLTCHRPRCPCAPKDS